MSEKNEQLLTKKMQDAFEQLYNELFCEETCMIYDSICSEDHEQRFDHLPFIEEIKANIPNPHGYATGMEDSMLNAGFAIELCIQRALSEPETRNTCEEFARKLLKGMVNCITVHNQRGYVARSISPRNHHSCYMESSRDQFTLFVYGMWRYYHSSFANSGEKAIIETQLAALANFAESRMNDSCQYNLGRLDGFPAMHLNMIKCKSHEALRLPMFFAAAYDVTRNDYFLKRYQYYYKQAIINSQKMHKRKTPWWHIELSQMQFSLQLCHAVDQDSKHRKCFEDLMTAVAEIAEKQTLDSHFPRMTNYQGSWAPPAEPWRESERFTMQLFDDETALKGGKIYLKGEESYEFKEAFDRIRAPGNMITAMMLAPNYQPDSEFKNCFTKSVSTPEYKKHTSGGLVNILCAYYLAKNKGVVE